jgi:transcriptional regulator with XRE-family HTH domain
MCITNVDDVESVMIEGWRQRLQQAFDAKGESMRAVSLKAGVSHGYLYTILIDGREPTITNMAKLAGALDVTLSWLLYGYDMGPQEEQLLRLYAQLPPSQRKTILDLASGLSGKE